MRRLVYFWKGLPPASKLQFLAMVLVLGSIFVTKDMHPRRRAFGVPLWQVTAPLIVGTFVLARLLLPLMLLSPLRAQRVFSWFGMSIFFVSILSMNQRWGRMLITHLGITIAMWLDVWCWFWFVSEIQWRAALLSQQQGSFAASEHHRDDENEETDR